MSNYKFVKPYSARVVVGGVVGITNKGFGAGTVWEGVSEDVKTVTIRISEDSSSAFDKIIPPSQKTLSVPIEYLEKTNLPTELSKIREYSKANIDPVRQPLPVGVPLNTNRILTTKNIIIGTCIAIGIFGLLKWRKAF
jgi:hypothetical protein